MQRLVAALPGKARNVDDVVMGRRFVAMRSGERVGLSSTLGRAADMEDLDLAQELMNKPLALAVCQLSCERHHARSLGLAALCASLEPPRGARVETGNVEDLLVREAAGREVAVVGDFPFWPRVRDSARRAHLLELRDLPGSAARERWPQILRSCELVAITSTTLLTRSLAQFLYNARGARVVLVGPSTPFSPALFELGVDLLAGSEVLNGPAVLEGVSENLPFRALKRRGMRQLLWRRS